MKNFIIPYLFITLLFAASCGQNVVTSNNNSPIILGDSSTIVTETDPQFLKDNIPDIEMASASDSTVAKNDTVVKQPIDTAKAEPVAKVEGFNIDIGTATIVITGIQAKEYKKQNASQLNDLSYALSTGNINNAKIVVTGAKNASAQQRYQSKLSLATKYGKLDLDKLGNYTSGWQKITDKNDKGNISFSVQGLNNPQYVTVTNAKIKTATEQALKARRTNNKDIQKWLKEIKNMRNANDKPGEITITNVQWKISGTDGSGKAFTKTIRMDL